MRPNSRAGCVALNRDLAVEFADDFGGRLFRRTEAMPLARIVFRHELGYWRNIGQARQHPTVFQIDNPRRGAGQRHHVFIADRRDQPRKSRHRRDLRRPRPGVSHVPRHPPRFGLPASPRSRAYPAVALRAPPQKLNSVQTSAGPVKVDRKIKNAAM
jgi:hypothetical protein